MSTPRTEAEVQLQKCGDEIRPLAATEVKTSEILEVERQVLDGMKDSLCMIKLYCR